MYTSSNALTILFNSVTSLSSKDIKWSSDLTLEQTYFNLETRCSKELTKVDPTTKDHFWNYLFGIKETTDGGQDDVNHSNKAMLKYTEQTYNVIFSLTKGKLGVQKKKNKQ